MKEVKKLFDEFLSDYSTGPEDELMLADLRRLVNAVKEECARASEDAKITDNDEGGYASAWAQRNTCAEAIRALDLSGETPE